MSDELSPPPLRLKPRIKLDADTPAAALPGTSLAAADSTAPSADVVEAPRFRLRPKLASEVPAAVNPVEAAPMDAPAIAARPIALKPRMSLAQPISESAATAQQTSAQPSVAPAASCVEAAPASSMLDSAPVEQQPKFKLKEKAPVTNTAAPAVSTSSSTPPIPVAAAVHTAKPAFSLTPPPFPVIAGPETSNTSSPLPPPIPTEGAKGSARPSPSSRGKLLFALLAITLISGGYMGYQKLTEPAAPAPAAAPVATVQRPETPSTTLNEISKIPAQAIKKAEDAIAAVNAKDAAGVQAVLSDEAAPKRPTKVVTKAAEAAVAPPTATTQLSPGLTVTTASKDVVGDASPAFRAWVAQAKVSGVFQGKPARVLINGRTVPAGQIVDDALGITFEGIDATAKLLIFRDSTGASVTRKF